MFQCQCQQRLHVAIPETKALTSLAMNLSPYLLLLVIQHGCPTFLQVHAA